jgi:FkbM family methyltransferase
MVDVYTRGGRTLKIRSKRLSRKRRKFVSKPRAWKRKRIRTKKAKAVSQSRAWKRRRIGTKKAKASSLPVSKNLTPKITFAGSNTVLFVNAAENRGKSLIRSKGVRHPKITNLWRKAAKVLQPTIVLDVGVNYGEIVFSTVYSTHAKIIGIEANEQLRPYLERSRSNHPNKNQINIIYALAGAKDGEEKTFYIDNLWSGTSSVVNMNKHPYMVPRKVNSVTIDSLFQAQELFQERLLFKIDVEGYEEYVMKGMSRLISECEDFIGLIEFNREYMEAAGTDVPAYLSWLHKQFDVYMLLSEKRALMFSQLDLQHVNSLLNKYGYTDFVLLPKNKPIRQLQVDVQTVS